MAEDTKAAKPGFLSTEFWGTVLGVLGMIAGALTGKLDAGTAALIGGVLVGLYTIARTIVKLTKTTKDDEFLDMIKEKILDKIKLG